MHIFVDAMGGDHAPKVVIAGLSIAEKHNAIKADISLLGDEAILKPLVKRLKKTKPQLVHCSEIISMEESPVSAVRTKKNSSIVRGLELTTLTPDSAFFSAGNSGAIFAAALMQLGRIPGVERPAIATVLPTMTGYCILLDAGANVDCRPQHLVDFAYMGSTYARIYLKEANPTIGILSNGEEDSKGTELTREASALLKQEKQLHYVGYVEGKEMFDGKAHVILTDGFTGNVVLKSLEGLGHTVSSLLQKELKRNWLASFGTLFCMPALKSFKRKLDYAEIGSAPLLGVDGNCFIGHGRSGAKAIKNGILRAQEAIERNLHHSLRSKFNMSKNENV